MQQAAFWPADVFTARANSFHFPESGKAVVNESEKIVAKYLPVVRSVVSRFSSRNCRRWDIGDLHGAVVERLIRSARKGIVKDSEGWVANLAFWAAKDEMRRQDTRTRREIAARIPSPAYVPLWAIDQSGLHDSSLMDSLARAEIKEELERAIDKLPERYRRVLRTSPFIVSFT